MCEELLQLVEWLYQNYSGTLGLYQPYAASLDGFVVAGLHFDKNSPLTNGAPVGVVFYGLNDRATAYCSLPVPCQDEGASVALDGLVKSRIGTATVDLPLAKDIGLRMLCLDGNLALTIDVRCESLYDKMPLFVVACGLLNKWTRLGGDVVREFEEIVRRVL